jgi:hypothetical protein
VGLSNQQVLESKLLRVGISAEYKHPAASLTQNQKTFRRQVSACDLSRQLRADGGTFCIWHYRWIRGKITTTRILNRQNRSQSVGLYHTCSKVLEMLTLWPSDNALHQIFWGMQDGSSG